MGILDKVKNFGSKIVKMIVKPRFDWKKLPKIDPNSPGLKPIGPDGKLKIKPITPGTKINPSGEPTLTPNKKPDKPFVMPARGIRPMSNEDMKRMKESMKNFVAKFNK